eukprot:SAG22_NODE_1861_length_3428_cov_7.939321_2_plen_370_part_00
MPRTESPIRGHFHLPDVWQSRIPRQQQSPDRSFGSSVMSGGGGGGGGDPRPWPGRRSVSPSRAGSALLKGFSGGASPSWRRKMGGRSPSPARRGGGGSPSRSPSLSIKQEAEAAEDELGKWTVKWGTIDFTDTSDPLCAALAGVQAQMIEKWLVGPLPALRATPMLKVLTREQMDVLGATARDTKPFVLELNHLRVTRVRKGGYAQMVALEAVFKASEIAALKLLWLSRLGSEVEDLEARLHDRSLPFESDTAVLTLARVAMEYGDEAAQVCHEANERLAGLTLPVSAFAVLEDVSVHRLSWVPLTGVEHASESKRPGWLMMVVADELKKLPMLDEAAMAITLDHETHENAIVKPAGQLLFDPDVIKPL